MIVLKVKCDICPMTQYKKKIIITKIRGIYRIFLSEMHLSVKMLIEKLNVTFSYWY